MTVENPIFHLMACSSIYSNAQCSLFKTAIRQDSCGFYCKLKYIFRIILNLAFFCFFYANFQLLTFLNDFSIVVILQNKVTGMVSAAGRPST